MTTIRENTVLFVCTGNYYRSRFTEYYFNHLARQHQKNFHSYSKGLNIYDNNNVGPMSKWTRNYLEELAVKEISNRLPEPLTEKDILTAYETIALYDKEHRPMVEKQFPHLVDRITYWGFPDVPILTPQKMLPSLKEKVEEYFQLIPK